MADQRTEVARLFDDYASAFSSLDVTAILPYYHEPCMFITAQTVVAPATRGEIEKLLTSMVQALRTRGYARARYAELHIKPLSSTLGLASGVAVRYKASGEELERIGFTYMVRKTGERWKIAMVAGHDTDTVLRLD